MTVVPKWKSDRCEHCAAGVPLIRDGFHYVNPWSVNAEIKCTAPTEAEYIAELEEKLAAAEETIACKESFLHNFKHAVKLEREDSEKELAAAEADTRRMNAIIEGHWAVHTFSGDNFKLYEICASGGYGRVLSRHSDPREAIDAAMKSSPVVTCVGTGTKSDA